MKNLKNPAFNLKIFTLFTVLLSTSYSCNSIQKPTVKDIYPLSPFHSFTDLEDENGKQEAHANVDYFVIYGNVSDTAYMRNILLDFVQKPFKDLDINPPNNYEIRFYKKSNKTNKDYKESHFDLLDEHSDDEYATVTYQKNGDHWLTFQNSK